MASGTDTQWAQRFAGEDVVPAADLVANLQNFRRHPKAQRQAMRATLGTVGWIQRVIVNKTTGRIVDGHLRVEEAAERGESVPVVYVELSEDEERTALLTFDPLGALAKRDDALLETLLANQRELDLDRGRGILVDLLHGQFRIEGLTNPDELPEAPDAPTSKAGDLWELGDHRLLCGDITNESDVDRLIDGSEPAAVVTDPPYGIGFTYATYDDARDGWFPLMDKAVPVMRRIAPFVVMPSCGIDRLGWWYGTHAPDWMIAWYKGSPGHLSKIGFNDWEALVVWGHPWKQMHDYFQTECGFDDRVGHPCPKPVAWASWLVERAADVGRIVVDPFAGAGTTLIAAEQLSRRCYAMEIDPLYIDVTVERWQRFTGREAKLIT